MVAWEDVLETLKHCDLESFNNFHYFHYFPGIGVGNLSPFERYVDICQTCEDINELFLDALLDAATRHLNIDTHIIPDIDFCEEGIYLDFS